MKVTQMPPVHAAILVAKCDNTAYGVDVIATTQLLGSSVWVNQNTDVHIFEFNSKIILYY